MSGGRNPDGFCSASAYQSANPDVAAAASAGQINPLTHFLQYGILESRSGLDGGA